ncbi:hypothetical protein [Leptolyngbya sp. GB1-A1]|nr:hypothetical protein [Cyanobacteria bacterium FACHB-502]
MLDRAKLTGGDIFPDGTDDKTIKTTPYITLKAENNTVARQEEIHLAV